MGLREDLAPKGVGVSVILPGFISDAGMFAESGAKLPPYVGLKRPEDVARAVVKAIESNRAELDVAPLPLRAGAVLASLAPGPDRRDPAAHGRHGHRRAVRKGPGRQALAGHQVTESSLRHTQ